MGGTWMWVAGVLCLLAGGALYYDVLGATADPIRQWAGAMYGLVPVGFGLLGLALCGLGFIFKSNV